MNYLDIIIIVLVLIFGIGGWRKGIIIEIATLLALILGLYGAFHFSDFTAEQLVQHKGKHPQRNKRCREQPGNGHQQSQQQCRYRKGKHPR